MPELFSQLSDLLPFNQSTYVFLNISSALQCFYRGKWIKWGKFLKKMWRCIGGRVYRVIKYYHLSWLCKLATIKSFKAEVLSISPLSEWSWQRAKLFMMANSCYQLSWYDLITHLLMHWRLEKFTAMYYTDCPTKFWWPQLQFFSGAVWKHCHVTIH